MGLLSGKTALITGAARGIGKALALKFAEEGANIAFTDLVIDENGEATRQEVESKGVKCIAYASNAANFEETAEVVKKVHEDFGQIDIFGQQCRHHERRTHAPYDRSPVGCRD